MNKKIMTLCLMAVTMMCYAFSCNKDADTPPDNNGNNNNGNNNGNNPATTLPVNCDFAGASIPLTTSAMVGGVSFSFTDQRGGNIPSCAPSGTDSFCTNGNSNFPGINISGVLIADVSSLPELHKVTVKMFDNGRPSTKLSICDGNNVIGESQDYQGSNPNVTYTLNVGGLKASKLYIRSSEAIIYSVHIE